MTNTKIFFFGLITSVLVQACDAVILCPTNVTSFSLGINSRLFYKCQEEGKSPVIKQCPGEETYSAWKGKCLLAAEWSENSDLTTMNEPVLGRATYLGSLYDARKSQIMQADSLWNRKTILENKISDISYASNLKFFAARSTFDRLNQMDIGAGVKLEFLGGIVSVEGSAAFLRDSIESEKTVVVIMKAHYQTRTEMLPTNTPIDYTKVCSLEGPTHVITAITYGMDAYFVFKKTTRKEESREKVEGLLRVAVKTLPSVKIGGSGEAKIDESLKKIIENTDVKLFGDFVLDEQPTTYEESVKVFKQLPRYLGKKPEYLNAAKMKMQLTPITRFCDTKTTLLISISSNLIHTVTQMLQEIERTKLKAATLLMSDSVNNYSPLKDIMNTFVDKLHLFEINIKSELQILIPNIRGGAARSSEKDLVELFTKYQKSPFYFGTSEGFLKVRAREIKLLDFILNPATYKDTGVKVLNFEEATDDKILFLKPIVLMLKFNVLPSIEIVNKFLQGKAVDESKKWFNDPRIIATMGYEFKRFMQFATTNKNNKDQGFLVALYNANKTFLGVIAQRKGEILSSSFRFPDQPPMLVSTSTTHNSITYDVDKPKNEWATHAMIKCWKYTKTESAIEKKFQLIKGKKTIATITELSPNVVYQCAMNYVTVIGNSPSGTDSYPIVTRPCSPPANLRTKDITSTSFHLEWDPPLDYGIGIDVRNYEVNIQGSNFVRRVTTGKCHVVVGKLDVASVYNVYVQARADPQHFNVTTQPKEITSLSIAAQLYVITAPNAPSTPRLVSVSTHSAEITWQQPDRIAAGAIVKEYLVKYAKMDNKGSIAVYGNAMILSARNRTNTIIKDLVQGTTYGISVMLITSLGSSIYSPVLIVKTNFKETELDRLRKSVKTEIEDSVAASSTNITQNVDAHINGLKEEINKFRKNIECIKPVYYPEGRSVPRCFPEKNLYFVGNGYSRDQDASMPKNKLSLHECITLCEKKRKSDGRAWDVLEWYSPTNLCLCKKNARGFKSLNNILAYKFN